MSATGVMPLVRADAVSLRIGARRIVDRLSLHSHSGELIGVIGPNGAGKSTLLRLLASLLRPDTGCVFIAGRDVTTCSRRDIARVVASVPQHTSVDFAFTVRETVLMGRHPHVRRFAVESEGDLAMAHQAIEQTGLAALAERSLTTLSGGERQLVFIAKALAQKPRVLLLDEPVTALDIRHQLDMLNLITRQVASGLAAIAVLHDLNLAARFCDRLALMAQGRVLAFGTPPQVLTEAALATAYRVRSCVRLDPVTDSVSVTALASMEAS